MKWRCGQKPGNAGTFEYQRPKARQTEAEIRFLKGIRCVLPATCHHNHPGLMGLAKKFLEDTSSYYWSKQPKLFYLWGHSYEFNDNDNWQVIEDFAAYVGGRADVWYATNGEICDYAEAYDRLRFGVNGDFVYNPSAINVYLNYYDKQYIVPAGRTVKLEL